MKSILLSAYAISPTKGSEFGVGWNFASNLAKTNIVYVLCGCTGGLMGDTSEIEAYLVKHPNPNIRLIPVRPTRLTNAINWLNKIGLFGPVFYLALPMWQKQAYERARQVIATERIDIVHQLNPIGFRDPGYLWKLDKPFVWGPIGGATFASPVLLRGLPVRDRIYFLVKNLINFIQLRWSTRVHAAADKASVLLFSNSENQANFEHYLDKTGQLMPENASFSGGAANVSTHPTKGERLHLVWIGQISPRKNLHFILKALALVENRDGWVLHIVGDGKIVKELRRLSSRLGIADNVQWCGAKTRQEVISFLAFCDLHVMASIAEGSPTVFWEAIGAGVPTLSLDRDGMRDTLINGGGILVPVSSYANTLVAYATKIDEIVNDPGLLISLREGTRNIAKQESWEIRVSALERVYDAVSKSRT